ncbi:MAG TPA: DUF1284 domain-containing protein [Nitrospiraceae bacterium]|nr:MAG: hypothetical protein A2Z82_05415 [Nitrospirae bacterium GWA2_46_11]OGW25088.1 MAG: hypothetical protein A2X55_01345 [Nitrospirae bacterium GWB2_47_37]HAK88028.1 DUF1284 domain-containing protein [Nitrospiraceae bacterium]HCL80817.1 DUF1284 domain-containing protein [Nitrospiraceae bacterium]HCZ11589.1 DUF1284 domain-containing protein [Nitrospiraceae bacterium]
MLIFRGHHLICLHFFSGDGYDASFIENLRDVIKRAESEEIEIVSGDDDVCAKCLYLKDHKCAYDENADEEIREMDETALRLLNLRAGQRVTWQAVKEYMPGIFREWYNRYCNDCDWKQACEKNEFYRERKGNK